MRFIAQSNTLPVHHAMTQQQAHKIWTKLYYRMKCTYCTVYWNTSSHQGAVRLVTRFLPSACSFKACSCFSDSPRLTHSAHNLLMRFTGSLNSFTHTISRDEIVYIFCMGVRSYSHNTLPDYSNALRTYHPSGESVTHPVIEIRVCTILWCTYNGKAGN